MKKLRVEARVPQENWHIPLLTLIEIEAVAVRAWRQEGAGSAIVSFEAKTADGTWYPLLKKNNRGVKLPKHTEMTWKNRDLIEVRGVRGVYQYETEEVAI